MTPNRHPSDAMLFADGAGALSPGLSLVLAAHRAVCPRCRRAAGMVRAAGGALLTDAPPAAMAADALSRALAAVDADSAVLRSADLKADGFPTPADSPAGGTGCAAPPAPPASGDVWAGLAPALRSVLAPFAEPIAAAAWKRLGWGVKILTLEPRRAYGGGAYLIRMKPGAWAPRHGHNGLEATLVLSGGFADENGRYEPGDLVEADDDCRHQPIVDGSEECLCLAAMDGELRFDGVFGRLLSPFMRL